MGKKDFNEFRFSGLNPKKISNKYVTMNRVSEDENKIVICVGDSHLLPTRFGYAFILDRTHVVFIKDWQVSQNYFQTEVLLTREYFTVKEWGDHADFCDAEDKSKLTFDHYLEVAKEQQNFLEIEVDEDGEEIEVRNIVKWQVSK